MVYYVYILRCESKKTGNKSLYTGSTQDLQKRIDQHQKGQGAKYTRGKYLLLAYFETFLTRSEAMKREYEIKTYSTEQKRDLIKQFEADLQE